MLDTTQYKPLKPGYRAFNGYILTETDCKVYNAQIKCTMNTPDSIHKLFCQIIGVYRVKPEYK